MTAGAHPRHRLDDVVHHPVRFSLMATLAAVDKVDFAALRDDLEVSDSVLSKQVATLEAAGYVEVTKGRVGRRPRTWLAASASGRAAFAGHVAALSAIASGVAAPGATVTTGGRPS